MTTRPGVARVPGTSREAMVATYRRPGLPRGRPRRARWPPRCASGARHSRTAGRGEHGDLRTARALAGCQDHGRCLLVSALPSCPPIEFALPDPPSASVETIMARWHETASVEHATDVLPGVTAPTLAQDPEPCQRCPDQCR